MTTEQQHINIQLHKIFDSCELDDQWIHKKNSESAHDYIALKEGAKIVLTLDHSQLIETFRFKKGANISLKNSIVEYYDKDLLQ